MNCQIHVYLTLIPTIIATFSLYGMEKTPLWNISQQQTRQEDDARLKKEERRIIRLIRGEKRAIAEKKERLLSKKQIAASPQINYHQPARTSGRQAYYETDPLSSKTI